MPSVSRKQQSYMVGCLHNPKHMKGECPDKETAREFARTPRKGLPERKSKRRKPKVEYPR
jgi:hypothetical protein